MTRWHKIFHILVFGAIAALAVVVFVLRQEFRAQFSPFAKSDPETTRVTYDLIERVDFPADDALGGSSPEETYLLFLGRLRDGTVRDATAYFVASKAGEWREILENFSRLDALPQLLTELEALPASWQKAEPEEGIAVFTTASQTITFVKNPHTSVWKIYSL
ncbi:MAG: hypothetical protein Q8Q39_01535 [bacterium]|nr:hypothetical protein [bacterium]